MIQQAFCCLLNAKADETLSAAREAVQLWLPSMS